MKVRSKASFVLAMPDGSILSLPKGRIAEVPTDVYDSCWELLERLDTPAPPIPQPNEVKKHPDIAIEVGAIAPAENAMLKKPVIKRVKR